MEPGGDCLFQELRRQLPLPSYPQLMFYLHTHTSTSARQQFIVNTGDRARERERERDKQEKRGEKSFESIWCVSPVWHGWGELIGSWDALQSCTGWVGRDLGRLLHMLIPFLSLLHTHTYTHTPQVSQPVYSPGVEMSDGHSSFTVA